MLKGLAEALGWLTVRTVFVLMCVVRALVSSLLQSGRSLVAQLRHEHSQHEDEDAQG
jgi:hypothetical protein